MADSAAIHDSSYLLLDDIASRICAAWRLVPTSVREDDSLIDKADYLSRFAHCSESEAIARLEWLLAAGILRRDGSLHEPVQQMLDKVGALRLTAGDDLLPTAPDDDPDEDDDEDED